MSTKVAPRVIETWASSARATASHQRDYVIEAVLKRIGGGEKASAAHRGSEQSSKPAKPTKNEA